MRLKPICALMMMTLLLPLTGCWDRSKENTAMSQASKVRHQLRDAITDSGVTILENGVEARAYEVSRPRPGTSRLIGGAPVVAEGPELTRADVDKLRALVFMDNHYVLDRKKRVPFIPQLAVVLKTAEGETTVLAALYTAQLRFVYGDQQVTIDCDPSVEEWREFALNFIKLPGLNEAQQ